MSEVSEVSKGTIRKWDNKKHDGIIHSDAFQKDILCDIHVFKNLPDNLYPAVGDVVKIQVKHTAKGLKIVKALYPQTNYYDEEPVRFKNKLPDYKNYETSKFFPNLIKILVALVIGYILYQNFLINQGYTLSDLPSLLWSFMQKLMKFLMSFF